jgi:hypothetical protein
MWPVAFGPSGITNNIERMSLLTWRCIDAERTTVFEGFGEIKYELYEPILHEVGPETLLRFEQNTVVRLPLYWLYQKFMNFYQGSC